MTAIEVLKKVDAETLAKACTCLSEGYTANITYWDSKALQATVRGGTETYRVDIGWFGASCLCPHTQYRRQNICKHIALTCLTALKAEQAAAAELSVAA